MIFNKPKNILIYFRYYFRNCLNLSKPLIIIIFFIIFLWCNHQKVKILIVIIEKFCEKIVSILMKIIHCLHILLIKLRSLKIICFFPLSHYILIRLRNNCNKKVSIIMTITYINIIHKIQMIYIEKWANGWRLSSIGSNISVLYLSSPS